MSSLPISHEEYAGKTPVYKENRVPIGLNEMLEFFGPEAKYVLDCGCGTGNYLINFLRFNGGFVIHGIDASTAMLDEAKKALEIAESEGYFHHSDGPIKDKVNFYEGNLCDPTIFKSICGKVALKGGENSKDTFVGFDALISNQTMHHLRNPEEEHFKGIEKALQNFYDSLNPNGGKMVINYCPPYNHEEGIWWCKLLKKGMEEFRRRSPPAEIMKSMLEKTGFKDVRIEPLLGENDNLYRMDAYCNVKEFLIDNGAKNMFYEMDSTFAMSTPEELASIKQQVQTMVDNNTWDTWFAERETMRKKIGQSVNVYAVRRD